MECSMEEVLINMLPVHNNQEEHLHSVVQDIPWRLNDAYLAVQQTNVQVATNVVPSVHNNSVPLSVM